MRLILLRSTCDDTRSCPNINATDRGTYVVQGYLVADHAALAPGESVVEVPSSLLPNSLVAMRPMMRSAARAVGPS